MMERTMGDVFDHVGLSDNVTQVDGREVRPGFVGGPSRDGCGNSGTRRRGIVLLCMLD